MKFSTALGLGMAVIGAGVALAARQAPTPGRADGKREGDQADWNEFRELASRINLGVGLSAHDYRRYDQLSLRLTGKPAFVPIIE